MNSIELIELVKKGSNSIMKHLDLPVGVHHVVIVRKSEYNLCASLLHTLKFNPKLEI